MHPKIQEALLKYPESVVLYKNPKDDFDTSDSGLIIKESFYVPIGYFIVAPTTTFEHDEIRNEIHFYLNHKHELFNHANN